MKLPFLDRFRANKPQHVRRFDGASHARRTSGFGSFGRINGEVSGSAHTIRSRARYLASNNPWVAHAAGNWVGSLVGSGIVPTPKHPDQTIRAALASHYHDWAEDADADGRTNFDGMLADIARGLVIDGESFVQIIATEDGPQARLIPPELVDESKTIELANGGHIISGVEFDADGRRVAYHVFPSRPTDQFGTYAPAVRIPAESILHVMKPIAAGQVRGISWLAPIILPASELDQLTDALLVGVKIAAMHAGFITGTEDAADGFDLSDISLEPGVVRRLPMGYDIKFSTPQQANQTNEFVKTQLRQLAAGLGLPSHLLDGDLTGANYSSLRAGLLPFRQRVEALQYHVLVPQLLRPVWRRVVSHAVLFGDVASDNPRDLFAVEWLMPRPLQVDPMKDVEATVAEIEAGLTSRSKAVSERGWDIDALDAEIAADRQRETTLGLSFSATPPNHQQQRSLSQMTRHETDFTRRMPVAVAPSSYDEASRTVEAVISTGSSVNRSDKFGSYVERLDLSAINPDDLIGVPVQLDHDRSVKNTVGTIIAATRDASGITATIQLTGATDAAPIRERVADGTLSAVSIGYAVSKWAESKESGQRVRTAARWKIHELSIVSVGADPGAKMRGSNMEDETMPVEQQQQIRSLAELAGLTRGWAEDQIDSGVSLDDAREAARSAITSRQSQTPRIRVATSHEDPAAIRSRREDAIFARASGTAPADHAREFMGDTLRDHARGVLEANGVSTRAA